MRKEFLIVPGKVTSIRDGDIHFISAHQLINLYGVKRDECIIVRDDTRSVPEGLLYLEPSYEGDYTLPDVFTDPCEPYQPDDTVCRMAVINTCAFISQIIPV